MVGIPQPNYLPEICGNGNAIHVSVSNGLRCSSRILCVKHVKEYGIAVPCDSFRELFLQDIYDRLA
jgi:hypothetical protein